MAELDPKNEALSSSSNDAPAGAPEEEKKGQDGELIKPPTPKAVKRKRRRTARLIVLGATFAGVAILGVIAFLGNNFGTFSVKIDNRHNASLQLGTTLDPTTDGVFLQDGTSYLSVNGITAYRQLAADELPSFDILDADLTKDNYDGVMARKRNAIKKMNAGLEEQEGSEISDSEGAFFCYTFYVRNVQSKAVNYEITFATTSVKEPDNLYSTDSEGNQTLQSVALEKAIRVRVFENLYSDSSETHEQETFAYPRYSASGQEIAELVSKGATGDDNPNAKSCTNFVLSSDPKTDLNFTVFDRTRSLPADGLMRYTVVMWFEGGDEDTDISIPPEGGSLSFGVDVKGLEESAS